MRLQDNEVGVILSEVKKAFADARVYLFGSRLDDTRRGGDIDLFIVPAASGNTLEQKIRLVARLQRLLHKPVDVVIHRDFSRTIEQEALKGVCLNG